MGSTVSVVVRICNYTFDDIKSIYVYDFDSFDFGSDRCPDKVLNGLNVPAACAIERAIDLNSIASNCPFTTKLYFKSGVTDAFKINYKYAYDNTWPNLRHIIQNHVIDYNKRNGRVIEITIRNTEEQIENHQAEKLNKEAGDLIEAEKFQEASVKLLEASRKANQSKTKQAIEINQQKLGRVKNERNDAVALSINDEALQLLKDNKYQQALDKFDEAYKIAKKPEIIMSIEDNIKKTKEAKINQNAKKINQEGLLLKKNNQLDEALKKFNEALSIATDQDVINSIRVNKSEILYKQSKLLIDEAWNAELAILEDKDESMKKFIEAKTLLEEACAIKTSPEYQNIIDIIDIKLEGDKYFNMGAQLETEGSQIVDNTVKSKSFDDCTRSIDKYKEAMNNYKKAREIFSGGISRESQFMNCVVFTEDAVDGVQKILQELEKAKLDLH